MPNSPETSSPPHYQKAKPKRPQSTHRLISHPPGYFDIDATLSKSFGIPKMRLIGENGRIEFRANFYNLFNRLNLNGNGQQYSGGIQAEITNSHFGESQSALGARIIELQARFSF